MKVLHVLKSEPDEAVKKLMEHWSGANDVKQFDLHKENVNYDKLVELVFENDKVICWW
ncbi:MAG: hypothetical protein KJ573_09740 [Proteobacteria bacterium]|nr:hypothetical protein [Pseudomonadota bacterium]MBU1903857.1 hypothetical protein [Pseudomonadota bacterium]